MIMKLNFNFNVQPAAAALPGPAAAGDNRTMPEALDVTCPCCEALLKVDPETGAVVWVDKKKGPARTSTTS